MYSVREKHMEVENHFLRYDSDWVTRMSSFAVIESGKRSKGLSRRGIYNVGLLF